MCKGLAALPATCLKSAKDIKHKIGFLLQKTEPQQEQKPLKEKLKATENRVSPVEAQKWKTSFNYLIQNEHGRNAFSAFLQSEYSQENIEFWEACEEFKQTSVDKFNLKAGKIFKLYVEADSPNEVNLDSATRESTRKNLETCDASCFDEAQSKIFTLMEKDSYIRFLKSKLFLEMCQPPSNNKPCSLEKRGQHHISEHIQCVPSYA